MQCATMIPDWSILVVVVAVPIFLAQVPAAQAFVAPIGSSLCSSNKATVRCSSGLEKVHPWGWYCRGREASRQGNRPHAAVCSAKHWASDGDGAACRKRAEHGGRLPHTSSGGSIGAEPSGPPSRLDATPTRAVARGERERPIFSTAPDSVDSDVHVLVPVKDVVTVPLADISEAAADSLGGGDTCRVSMERFCNTLEGVFRTEFSVKVDRANADFVLGGRRYGNSASRRSRVPSDGGLYPPQKAGQITDTRVGGGGGDEMPAEAAGTAVQGQERANTRVKSKPSKWRVGLRRKIESKVATGGDKGGVPPAPLAVVVADDRLGRRRGGRKKTNANGGGSGGDDAESTREAAIVPMLELVDELVRNAMFSPIGVRDVMMSQALAAEFPTAAGVRPVFGSLANVYELLRRRRREGKGEVAESCPRGKGAAASKRISDSERAMLPFEGRLLVFWRGNGVEETRGRLLLRKIDYLQSNAVGWLSQSITDTLKAGQQEVVLFVDAMARDLARRKDRVVRSCAEGAIAFGLERGSLKRFLQVSNITEIALTKEQEALDEALEALRRNSRRGPVNLQRYGLREVNVKLEEFSEGGAWPPGDDSWFWDAEVPRAADPAWDGGAVARVDESPIPGDEVPSTVLPRVTLASVLSPGSRSVPRRSAAASTARNSKSTSTSTKSTGRLRPGSEPRSSGSALSRLLSKCTVTEPTYDEVVVVYFKKTRRPIFQPPPAVAVFWRLGTRISNRVRGVEQVDTTPDDADEVKDRGLGLQLRVYRGVPLVNLNSIAPDKKVEVRPQTALRLDLNSVVGLGLVLANLRFDSPVLVAAATVSVVLLVIRTIVGYLNARIRVESFVSRDILDKTMGSNVPVLRHLAEEAAQQKSRHVAMVYASLLQCAIDHAPEPTASSPAGEVDWDDLTAVSTAAVSRHCYTMMKACVALPWEAKVDVPYWLKELEHLKILVRVDSDWKGGGNPSIDKNSQSSLPLALEGLGATSPASPATPEPGPQGRTAAVAVGSTAVVFYRLLDPEAAVGQLKLRWSELLEPPTASSARAGNDSSGELCTPWRKLGVSRGGEADARM